MNVRGVSTDPESEWTTPYPTRRFGVIARLLQGDVMAPDLSDVKMRPGREGESPNWFNCIPRRVHRAVVGPRPFLSIGVGRFGVYMGWKVFGVDSTAYLDYPGITPADVFKSSRAMCGTIRFTMSRAFAK